MIIDASLSGTVEISGDATVSDPTANQMALFRQIRESYSMLSQAALDALAEDCKLAAPPVRREALCLKGIHFADGTTAAFSFYFGVRDRSADLERTQTSMATKSLKPAGCTEPPRYALEAPTL